MRSGRFERQLPILEHLKPSGMAIRYFQSYEVRSVSSTASATFREVNFELSDTERLIMAYGQTRVFPDALPIRGEV